jgi:hypothetical protein
MSCCPPVVEAAIRSVDIAVGNAEGDRSGLVGGGLMARPVFDEAAKLAMRQVVEWIDNPVEVSASDKVWHRKAKPRGVYRVDSALSLERDALLDEAPPASDKAYLVLLHGTFSHTEGAFQSLRGTSEWRELATEYQGRIVAVEHATLGRTPAQNALEAVGTLPEGTKLHLVSHSRGGLVGEALSYAASQQPDVSPYPQDHPDREVLPELHKALSARGISVERFVRVACPARGTTLASRRLDRWASFMFNVFNLVPVLRETGIAELIKKFLLTVLDQRTDPRIVPGLEAQMPESPFLRMLLRAQGLDDGLGSIAGDVQGSGIAKRLLVLGADLFYREDHDFVVPTSSMSGGISRTTPRSAFFKGSDVSHGSYFANVDSRRTLRDWLKNPPDKKKAIEPRQPSRPRGTVSAPKATASALLIPDLFGCRHLRGEECTWPDVGHVARKGMQQAFNGRSTPAELVKAYDGLHDALAADYVVKPFAYSSKEPVAKAAKRLVTTITEKLASGEAPHLVAHGVGALIVLAALNSDDLHDRWRQAGGRAVLLGPPLAGSVLVEARLAGLDEFAAAVALLDGTMPKAVGEWLASWPMLKILMPEAKQERDLLMPKHWAGISAVYGTADQTVSGQTEDGTYTVSTGGDGFAFPRQMSGLASWHAVVPHADLPGDPDTGQSVLDLLADRSPTKLLSSSPAGPPGKKHMPDPRGQLLLPTDEQLVRMAWGGGNRPVTRQVLRVSVLHGHLKWVEEPVLVGHQDGTPVGGAEVALNRHLKNALKRRLNLRQYPGPLGTCEVFENADGPAGVVIGIGDAGDLTPRTLTAGVIQAVLRLVAVHIDRAPDGTTPEPLPIAAVLMGTTLVPAMPVENSLTAIVTGVRQANRKLRDLGLSTFVDELKIVERYEDRAIQATKAAIQLAGTLGADGGSEVLVEGRLLEGIDGRRGVPRPDYHDDMWRTVRIVAAEPGEHVRVDDRLTELSFTSIGRDAGVQQRVNTSQRKLLDALVREAVDKPVQDAQLFNTLYEMLLPNALKEQGYGSEHLSVVVDEQAGVLPLEMLASRTPDEGVLPLSVQVGVLRRLETRTFTEGTRPSSGRAALVIGDPAGTGLPRLTAAREEARKVCDLLQGMGYEVTSVIPDEDSAEDVVGILNALFAHEYRIVHIAGHGNYDPVDPTRSGVLIGPETYLGALEIAKMRTTPDLVFVNCCHLAAMRARTDAGHRMPADRFASSISRQLVENGVRAVIAAGWAVDDKAACAFASKLYRDLLDGRDLGIATLGARKKVYDEYGWTNTWGAYQVYGPPAFRLDPGRPARPALDLPVARRELVDRLADLEHRAEGCEQDQVQALTEELEKLIAGVPRHWLVGQEQSAVGYVWSLLAEHEQAVKCLQAVRDEWDAEGSVRTIEQLANVQAKWAVHLITERNVPAEQAKKRVEQAKKLLAEAERSARLLLELGKTPERHCLLGSIASRHARCALTNEPGELLTALITARDAYKNAVDLDRERHGKTNYYPALNEVVMTRLVVMRKPDEPFDADRIRELIAQSREAAAEVRPPTFWSRVTKADADVAEALLPGNDLLGVMADLTEAYREVFAESSLRDRTSVAEHIDIIAWALPPDAADEAKALRTMSLQLLDG